LAYVEGDPQLYSAIETDLPKLRSLTPLQVEKLVFYLKSLHTYYPKSENHADYLEQFLKRLDQLRNSDEQRELQRQANGCIFKGMGLCLLSGTMLTGTAVLSLSGSYVAGVLVLFVALALALAAVTKFFHRSILISKEQDRRYFLSCIRTASACNELDWSGLFTYHKANKTGLRSEADEQTVHAVIAELTTNLRAALYNDEFFQYSDPRLMGVIRKSEG
jgi:hypothetical protein